MADIPGERGAEAEIRGFIEARARAIRQKDVDALIGSFAADAVTFDVVEPLRNSGRDAVRRRAQAWFSSYGGPMGYEMRDLRVHAGERLAYGCFLNRVIGTMEDGKHVDMWWRATLCLERIDGAWKIVHEHDSVPLDPHTGKALTDLEP